MNTLREARNMAKIIAICGSPSSGKTTAGLKIAEEIYYSTNL